MGNHQLSQEAFDRLKAELDDLSTRGRIEVADKIERARELGDLSENGDYHAAKDEQGHMEGRIRQLEHLIENAEIIAPPREGVVGAGSVVTVMYEGDSESDAERYLVGHIEEKVGDLDVVSPTAPLGAALIGAHAGDWVSYEAPNGTLRVQVLKVEAV
jgi:transcription elongation factor GreA